MGPLIDMDYDLPVCTRHNYRGHYCILCDQENLEKQKDEFAKTVSIAFLEWMGKSNAFMYKGGEPLNYPRIRLLKRCSGLRELRSPTAEIYA